MTLDLPSITARGVGEESEAERLAGRTRGGRSGAERPLDRLAELVDEP